MLLQWACTPPAARLAGSTAMALHEGTKIATCCYCGGRSVLQLNARDGHELACGSCGAPLHEMKAMPVARRKPAKPRKGSHPAGAGGKSHRKSKSKPKKKKGFGYWLAEAIDEIADILD